MNYSTSTIWGYTSHWISFLLILCSQMKPRNGWDVPRDVRCLCLPRLPFKNKADRSSIISKCYSFELLERRLRIMSAVVSGFTWVSRKVSFVKRVLLFWNTTVQRVAPIADGPRSSGAPWWVLFDYVSRWNGANLWHTHNRGWREPSSRRWPSRPKGAGVAEPSSLSVLLLPWGAFGSWGREMPALEEPLMAFTLS